MAFDARSRSFFFSGPAQGLWRTDDRLWPTLARPEGIPPEVVHAEGFNHIGDVAFDAVHNRLLAPLECFDAQQREPNTCGIGAIAIVDPQTLQWRAYAPLHPGQVRKAMWVEVSPDGHWAWTSSGRDLLVYDTADLAAAGMGSGPDRIPVRAARVLRGVLPASSVTGAAVSGARLYVAVNGRDTLQVLSSAFDPRSGAVATRWRAELERVRSPDAVESEGLAFADALGGRLHWQLQPLIPASGNLLQYTPLEALGRTQRRTGHGTATGPPGRLARPDSVPR